MRQALHSYYVYFLDEELDEDSALHEVHKHTGISKCILDEAIEEWECKRTIRCVDGTNRSRGKQGKGKAPDGTSRYLKQFVDRENEEGRSVTAVDCQRYLASMPSTDDQSDEASRTPVKVCNETVRTWLRGLGYRHMEGKKGFAPTEARKARVREYLIDLARACAQEREDSAVLVFMDESYCHVNHCRTTSWYTENQTKSNAKCKGGRLIIVHAITRDGPLVASSFVDDQGFPRREGWFLKEDGRRSSSGGAGSTGGNDSAPSDGAGGDNTGTGEGCRLHITEQPTAEMLFPAGEKDPSDYHKNMDAEVFMKWLKMRLLPAFRAKYEEKKMILILDNAAYHHGMPDEWKSPLKATKAINAALLRDLGVETITVRRDGVRKTFAVPGEGKWFVRAPRGPTIEEVQAATFRVLKKLRPDALLTKAERFFKENNIGYLLYTPPYSPDFQPIELFWAHAKGYVASTWQGKTRTMVDTTKLLRYGFYGKRNKKEDRWEVEPPNCAKLVDHSITYANQAVARDAVLKGKIDNLRNVPAQYKVSKESGLEGWEDDEFDLFDGDVA